MKKEVPFGFSFGLYSDAEKDDLLRQFFNEFASQFKCRTIDKRKGWQKRMENALTSHGEVKSRDALIGYNSEITGIQQFSIALDGLESYAEGIYVREGYRRENIGMILRDVLFYELMKEGVQRFYIGDLGPRSAKILKTEAAQRFAEKDIQIHKKAIIDLKRTQKTGQVSSYGLELSRYNFIYDAEKVKIR